MACEFLRDASYAMVVLDEFNIALQYDYVRLEEVLAVLRDRPPMQHVVITGRGGPRRNSGRGRSGNGDEANESILSERASRHSRELNFERTGTENLRAHADSRFNAADTSVGAGRSV